MAKVKKKKPGRTLKTRVYVYFERPDDVLIVKRAAGIQQNAIRPNLSRYILEATMAQAARDLSPDHSKHTPGDAA